jgi:hypothetical protein
MILRFSYKYIHTYIYIYILVVVEKCTNIFIFKKQAN